MRSRRRQIETPKARAGLAPLELVLGLPIMLFVMGLMIVFGNAASWKVRTLTNARQAVWRAIPPGTGNNDPNPLGWPESAEMRLQGNPPDIIATDPYAEFQIVRGPSVTVPDTDHSLPIRVQIMDMTAGTMQGLAGIERGFPMLGEIPPRQFDFERRLDVLGGTRWQFWSMRIRSNVTRRVPFLFDFNLGQWLPDETMRYTQAAMNIVENPDKPALFVLDRDEEIRSFYGRYRDYHPRVNAGAFCTVDLDRLQTDVVEPLIERIEGRQPPRRSLRDAGVPGRLTTDFLRMYQSMLRDIENLLQDPNLPADTRAQLLTQRETLQRLIDQLQRFSNQLLQ